MVLRFELIKSHIGGTAEHILIGLQAFGFNPGRHIGWIRIMKHIAGSGLDDLQLVDVKLPFVIEMFVVPAGASQFVFVEVEFASLGEVAAGGVERVMAVLRLQLRDTHT